MPSRNIGSSIDSTVSYLLAGMLAIVFVILTIFGMKRIEATAANVKQEQNAQEVMKEEVIDISGDSN